MATIFGTQNFQLSSDVESGQYKLGRDKNADLISITNSLDEDDGGHATGNGKKERGRARTRGGGGVAGGEHKEKKEKKHMR
jgi:hypothetical protein